jgi:hypothetical protein
MLEPPFHPTFADPAHVAYEQRIHLLLIQLRDAVNLKEAYSEVLTDTIQENHRLYAVIEEASNEIERLRGQWGLVDDIARADVERPVDEG